MVGFFDNDSLLILASGDDTAELILISDRDKIIWRQKLPDGVRLNPYNDHWRLGAGTVLLFSEPVDDSDDQTSTGPIVEISPSKGVVSIIPLGTAPYSWIQQIAELRDGSLVVTTSGYRQIDENSYNSAGVVSLNPDRSVRWQKTYTNGYDDHLSAIQEISEMTIIVAGHSHRRDRYDGGKEAFWLVELDRSSGELLSQRFLHEPDGATISGGTGFKSAPTGQMLVSWAVQGTGMNDAQHQKCSFLLERY